MIYVFHGSDRSRVQNNANEKRAELIAINPDVQVAAFDYKDGVEERIKELSAGVSLFGEKRLIILRYFAETALGRDILIALVPHLVLSMHDVLIIEDPLTKEPLAKLEESGAKINKFMKPAKPGYSGAREFKPSHPIFAGYNIYGFSDAFGARDKKLLWVEYRTALTAGLPVEELFWKLSWQLKNMLIVAKLAPNEQCDVNPFVLNKSRSFLRNYKSEELPRLSMKLIEIYHKARRGQTDFETAIERFVLEL